MKLRNYPDAVVSANKLIWRFIVASVNIIIWIRAVIELGSLVRSLNNDLGAGKVIETSNLDAEIEYFYSVGQRVSAKVPLSSLEPVRLQRQTRCYLWLDRETWVIGRIFEWDDEIGEYQIDLPDKKSISAAEAEVYVRCDRPIADPIETLALKGHETPYFHNQRSPFVRCLVEQRAVSRGMTGLISANIDLYPHQVEVVRRVLEDRVQRYLLADEVGLGKTIEAGAILRQYLLDESHGRVVVLVPQYLLEQWRQELEDKFYISHFGKRVQLIAVEDVEQVSAKSDLGLLILDEAHHIAAMATASSRLQRQSFETCKRLAHQSDRLLLLSATPVLNHEQDFLAMLHLLDPTTYRLDDLEGFRDRVQKRQEIGRVLLSFREDAKPFVLKTKLSQIGKLFPEDKYLLSLTDELANCLQQETPASPEQIVRAIRTHISDTYRLHRRMLRNRRASVEDVIFERNATPKLEYDLDERSPDIHELIDEWRTVAPDEQYSRIFLLLFRASGTSFSVLEAVVAARLNGVSSAELRQDFGADDVRILVETPRFAGEAEILQSVLKTLQQPSEDGDRVELLRMMLLNQLLIHFKIQGVRASRSELVERLLHRIRRPLGSDRLPKIVVFTSFTPACAEIVRCLSNTFGEKSVASHQFGKSRNEVEENLRKFRCQPDCFILVCDPSGEEGRNLQFAEQLIHFDLPWSPNRLEQRIGRLDRIGSKMGVQSWVFAGPDLEDSPQDAWYRLLKDGFGIFQQSIASLQFYVDEKLPQLELALFQSGAAGLLEAIPAIQQEVTAEQVEISEQNALDEIDALDESATQYFRNLDEYDGRHQELQGATEGWVCQALNFQQLKDPTLSGVLRYQPTTRTLVPLDDLRTRFASRVEQSGTYNRRVANQTGVRLYRVGEEFTQALASYIRWDDRGQAFAMWRHDEAWDAGEGMEWVGFQFDYLVETDLDAAKHVTTLEQNRVNHLALERRADALLPPRLETIFLDAQMTVVEDGELLNILQRPYRDKSRHCRDYNLAKDRLSVLDRFVDPNEWPKFCRTARSTSEELLRDRPSFIEFCQQQTKSAEQKLTNRVAQLRLRLNQLVSTERVLNLVLEEELSTESALSQALVEGVRQPRISLDSVGFIIVSGRPLQSQEDGDY